MHPLILVTKKVFLFKVTENVFISLKKTCSSLSKKSVHLFKEKTCSSLYSNRKRVPLLRVIKHVILKITENVFLSFKIKKNRIYFPEKDKKNRIFFPEKKKAFFPQKRCSSPYITINPFPP